MSDNTTRRKALRKLGLLALAGYVAPAMTSLAGDAQAKSRKRSHARKPARKKGAAKKS